MTGHKVKVWDLVIRFFHWLLVIAFSIAYLIEDEWMTIHRYSGYLILLLIAIRIIYGFIGTRYARFTNFIYSPKTALYYVKDVFLFKPKRYLGHNPAGGLMILIMLLCLIATSITGMMALAMEERAGLMVNIIASLPYWLSSMSEDLHELMANFTVLLVLIHITGVIVESIVHGENLAKSMIDGKKHQTLRD